MLKQDKIFSSRNWILKKSNAAGECWNQGVEWYWFSKFSDIACLYEYCIDFISVS